jgi:hypothetical protein
MAQTAILLKVRINSSIANTHLAANLVNPGACLYLLERKGNLLFRKSALIHGMSPFSIGEM